MQSDEAALHNAIAASPADDTPHLVLADYYDDNGHPEKAAMHRFITDPTHPGKYEALVAAHGGDSEAAHQTVARYARDTLRDVPKARPLFGYALNAVLNHGRGQPLAARAHTAAAVTAALSHDSASTPHARLTYGVTNTRNIVGVPGAVNDLISRLNVSLQPHSTAAYHAETAETHERIAELTAGTHSPLYALNTVAARIHREAAKAARG